MKTTRLAAFAAVPLVLAAAGCAQIASLGGGNGADSTKTEGPAMSKEPPAELVDGLILAAVDSVSPEACPEGDAAAYPMSRLAADPTMRCVIVIPDETIEVTGGTVEEVPASGNTPQSSIEIGFAQADADALADLTGALAERTAPQNQLAVIAGDQVLSAPLVMAPLTDGAVQISGDDLHGLYEALAR